MAKEEPCLIAKLDALEFEIETEYSDLGDFIFKLPRFLESEEELESIKLDSYFPIGKDDLTDHLRKLRYESEFKKINHSFPLNIANANLFLATSFFEGWLLRLAKEFEESLKLDFSSTRGTGFQKLIRFFKNASIDLDSFNRIEQVYIAMKIRNCMIHTHGLMSYSRDDKEIRPC